MLWSELPVASHRPSPEKSTARMVTSWGRKTRLGAGLDATFQSVTIPRSHATSKLPSSENLIQRTSRFSGSLAATAAAERPKFDVVDGFLKDRRSRAVRADSHCEHVLVWLRWWKPPRQAAQFLARLRGPIARAKPSSVLATVWPSLRSLNTSPAFLAIEAHCREVKSQDVDTVFLAHEHRRPSGIKPASSVMPSDVASSLPFATSQTLRTSSTLRLANNRPSGDQTTSFKGAAWPVNCGYVGRGSSSTNSANQTHGGRAHGCDGGGTGAERERRFPGRSPDSRFMSATYKPRFGATAVFFGHGAQPACVCSARCASSRKRLCAFGRHGTRVRRVRGRVRSRQPQDRPRAPALRP